jgi:hypothetical protein
VLAAAIVGLGVGIWYWATRSRETARPSAPTAALPTPAASTVGSMANPSAPPAAPGAVEAAAQAAPTEMLVTAPRDVVAPARARTFAPSRRRTSPTETALATDTPAGQAGADEYRLLREARHALEQDPARALEFVNEHARRFAQGMLTQEREAIAIEALLQLHKEGQARSRAQSFFTLYPSSPYRARVERALGHARSP